MDSDLKQSVARLSVNRLDITEQVILDNILSILNVITGVSEIGNFILNQVNTMINYLSTAYDFNIFIISIIIIIVCIHNNVCYNITVYHVSMK